MCLYVPIAATTASMSTGLTDIKLLDLSAHRLARLRQNDAHRFSGLTRGDEFG